VARKKCETADVNLTHFETPFTVCFVDVAGDLSIIKAVSS